MGHGDLQWQSWFASQDIIVRDSAILKNKHMYPTQRGLTIYF
jgi:hypothetical protein